MICLASEKDRYSLSLILRMDLEDSHTAANDQHKHSLHMSSLVYTIQIEIYKIQLELVDMIKSKGLLDSHN